VTIYLRVWLVLLLFLPTGSLFASDDLSGVRQKLEQRFTDMKITDLKPSALAGLYEVTFGTHTAFVSADGRYMLMGDLIDLESRVNLTASHRAGLILKVIEDMGEKNMIVFAPKGQVKHTLTVFTDVDCPYCKRLHQEVPQLTQAGIKVRYMLFPRAGVGSQTYKRSVAVWCAKDRAKAIGIAKSGGTLEMKTCPNPIDRHLALGAEIGVEGTPTLVLDNGRVLPGYVPAAQLIAAFGGSGDKKPVARP
jgi:thiol:disulfide interchange protein DsbC